MAAQASSPSSDSRLSASRRSPVEYHKMKVNIQAPAIPFWKRSTSARGPIASDMNKAMLSPKAITSSAISLNPKTLLWPTLHGRVAIACGVLRLARIEVH